MNSQLFNEQQLLISILYGMIIGILVTIFIFFIFKWKRKAEEIEKSRQRVVDSFLTLMESIDTFNEESKNTVEKENKTQAKHNEDAQL